MEVEPGTKFFTVSSVADEEAGQRIMIVPPDDHGIYLGTTLIGHGISVIGGREGVPPVPTQLGYTSDLRAGNDLVVKIYWPDEHGTSELDTLKKAKGGNSTSPAIYVSLLTVRAACVSVDQGTKGEGHTSCVLAVFSL